ncbi:MAG: hypothetical protein Q8P18_18370 [Pseudomonadota bacterium]|nr:hypothetical protein [Pseudomonadota bacterium]
MSQPKLKPATKKATAPKSVAALPTGPVSVSLGGSSYEVVVPRSFADREAISSGFVAAGKCIAKSKKIFAATLGLCVPEVAELAKPHTLDTCDDDLFAYGKLVYDAIREDGVQPQEISDAAIVCFRLVCQSLYPRGEDVAKVEDFTEAGGDQT